jgi:hypothetical protein
MMLPKHWIPQTRDAETADPFKVFRAIIMASQLRLIIIRIADTINGTFNTSPDFKL